VPAAVGTANPDGIAASFTVLPVQLAGTLSSAVTSTQVPTAAPALFRNPTATR